MRTIAPAPKDVLSIPDSPSVAEGVMSYACQPCARRKVKCDRVTPACSNCRKVRLGCLYQAPPPRQRKRGREPDGDVLQRLARYEELLQANNILPTDEPPSPVVSLDSTAVAPKSLEPGRGKLLSEHGKSQYVSSMLWCQLGEENLREASEDQEDHPSYVPANNVSDMNPIMMSLNGLQQNLLAFHPSHEQAMKLWTLHTNNIEPLCRVLHIPTTNKMIASISQNPGSASKAQECLLFAIYHSAIFSITEHDCMRDFGRSRTEFMSTFRHAFFQALANVSWLRTTSMQVMQAYVLFLIVVRNELDPSTFWIMTGVGVRIAQRIGLHHDGESLGMRPFDVQMRRRLFWQLLPLDAFAGQISGTGISMKPEDWDTKQPHNINDNEIYPEMLHLPEEQQGATDMIFVLTKSELTKFYNQTGVKSGNAGAAIEPKDNAQLGKLIDSVESTIESKYLRYCDIVDPLHFLTLGIARSAANASRLRSKMPHLMSQALCDQERKQLCTLAQKIIDTDNAAYSNPSLKGFIWYFRSFFLWEALICLLTSLGKSELFTCTELEIAWKKVQDVFSNHPEVLESRRAIDVAVGRVALKSWTTNRLSNAITKPTFITFLQFRGKTKHDKHSSHSAGSYEGTLVTEQVQNQVVTPSSDFYALQGSLDGSDLDLGSDFDLNHTDWAFWDQLIKNNQVLSDQQLRDISACLCPLPGGRLIEDKSRAIATLTTVAISIARDIGICSDAYDDKFCEENCFAQQMARRLWFTICLMDLRVSLNQNILLTIGAEEAATDTKLPKNINDSDFGPSTEGMLSDREGLTDMTFSHH